MTTAIRNDVDSKSHFWDCLCWIAFCAHGVISFHAHAAVTGPGTVRRALQGHLESEIKALPPLRQVTSSQSVRMAISLPWRNTNQLHQLLAGLYDPGSPQYRHFLTPSEFTSQFGPTEADYQAVLDFAAAHGWVITGRHPNRMLLDVEAPASAIESAFQVHLNLYQHPTEDRLFFAPDVEPSVPSEILILDVSGLSNYRLPKSRGLRRVSPGQLTPHVGSGANQSYTAKDIRAAYAPGEPMTGVGQSVGLLEFDGFYAGDITKYRQYCGLSTITIQTVLIDGFNGVPSTGSNSGNVEVALDIEMVMAMAPGVAKILVYEGDTYSAPNDLISRMVNDNLAAQLSSSWSFGSGPVAATDQLFQQAAAQGQSFFNASGDDGAVIGPVPVPDESPYITLVGGTTLTTSGPVGSYVSERVWNAGGGTSSTGGISPTYPIPDWQVGISMSANRGSSSKRNIPDVALLADNVFAYADNGQQETLTGTSCAAPLWAGVAALANQRAATLGQPRIGFVNPTLYALFKQSVPSTYFHDITVGNNAKTGSNNKFPAVPGYDLCTGLGTPLVSQVISALALTDPFGIIQPQGFTANGPAGGPFDVASKTFALTNALPTTLSWTLGPLPNWLSASSTRGTLPDMGSGQSVTVRLSPDANQLSTGVFTANLMFTNLNSGSVQSRTVTLNIGQSLVANGGFETGDFSYWNLTGHSASYYNYADDGSTTPQLNPHSGNWSATFGQNFAETSAVAYLSQTLSTVSGQAYTLGFWSSPLLGTNGVATPNRFNCNWGSQSVYSVVNAPASDWAYHSFTVVAVGASTVLKFGATDDPAVWTLDDVSVIPIPNPVIQSAIKTGNGIGLSWSAQPGIRYQAQSSSTLNPGTWTNIGSPVSTSGSTLNLTDASIGDSQRFYRIVISP